MANKKKKKKPRKEVKGIAGKALSEAMRVGRIRMGLNQVAAGVELKRSRLWYSGLEVGRSRVNLDELGGWLDYLGIGILAIDLRTGGIVAGGIDVAQLGEVRSQEDADGLLGGSPVRRKGLPRGISIDKVKALKKKK